jgi:hypothetical protein
MTKKNSAPRAKFHLVENRLNRGLVVQRFLISVWFYEINNLHFYISLYVDFLLQLWKYHTWRTFWQDSEVWGIYLCSYGMFSQLREIITSDIVWWQFYNIHQFYKKHNILAPENLAFDSFSSKGHNLLRRHDKSCHSIFVCVSRPQKGIAAFSHGF